MSAVIIFSIILIVLTAPCSSWEKNSNSLVSSIEPVSEIGTAALNTNSDVISGEAENVTVGDVSKVQGGEVDVSPILLRRGRELPSNYHFGPYLDHPIVYHPTQWTTASATGAEIHYIDDLYTFYRAQAVGLPLGEKLSRFTYQKGTMRLDVVVQGSAMAMGRLLIAFDPKPKQSLQSDVSETDFMYLTRAQIVPHIVIDPSQTKTYSMKLPCPTVSGIWNSNLGSYRLSCQVLAPLGSGTAVTPIVTICYYLHMEQSDMGPMSYAATSAVESRTGGVLSTAFHKAGNIAKSVSVVPIPVISEGATLFSGAATAIGDFLSWFGFGKPVLIDRTIVSSTGFNNTPYFDSQTQTAMLSSRINNSVSFDPELVPLMNMEDMEVASICARPGFIHQMVATTAMSAGTEIHLMPVHPAYTTQYGNGGSAQLVEPTPLMFAAMFYSFWSGEITYKFDIVASVFHRCTLAFVYDPSDTFPTGTFEQLFQSNKHWVVTVSGNTELEITIPWCKMSPFRRVGSLLTPATGTTTNNGWIKVFLINPVTTNGSTSPVIINTYVSSKNIEFGQIDPTLSVTYVTTSAYVRTMGEEPAHTFKEIAARDTRLCEIKIASTANIARGDRVLVEWPCLPSLGVGREVFKPADGTNGVYTVSQVSNPNDTCLADIVAMAYVGYRGSVRFTVPVVGFSMYENLFVTDWGNYFQLAVQKFASEPTILNSAAMAILNPLINGNLSFTLPFYNPRGYFCTPRSYKNTDAVNPYGDWDHGARVYVPYEFTLPDTNGATSSASFSILKAAGDDMTFVGFRGMPNCIIRKNAFVA